MKSKNQARREKRKQQRQASAPANASGAEPLQGESAQVPEPQEPVALAENMAQSPTNEAAPNKAAPDTAPTAGASITAANAADEAAGAGESDTVRTNGPRSSVTMLARRYDWVTESNPLFEMYQQVTARFKRSRPVEEPANDEVMGGDGESETERFDEPVSKKKRRQEAKPTLADLKKRARRPELVEWFDADAQDPDFLVYLKTLPHAVQVPSNWRNRTDSPNFAPQPPYELPQNVVHTGIMEMRDPNADSNTKPGRLDVDYEKMHSAFFEYEQAPQLTSYGQVRDPKLRTLAFKPRKGPATAPLVPGAMSTRLREALGLRPDEDVPWAEAMRKHGPPPGYKDQEPVDVPLWGTSV